MRTRLHALVRWLLCGLLIGAAGKSGAAPRLDVPKVAFEKVVLPNGLQLILHQDKKLPLVHVNLWYHVGSKNEKVGKTGFAHLFEHMMLQGSKNAPEDYFSAMARAGAQGGRDSNGTTNSDRTNYFATAPSGSLEFLLWVHSDLLATLPDALTQAKLDNQRDVVRNERRQGVDNVPYGRWFVLATENLFPARHPYSWPVIGSHEDLVAASLEDVKAFFRRFYTPNNLTLVVSGDFDPAEAKRLVTKYFGSIPPGPALDRPRRFVAKLDGEKIVEVNDRVPQDRVFMAWPGPEIGAAGEHELNLASSILTEGLSARLQKTLIYDKKLCSNVSSFSNSMEIAGMFVIDATLAAGVSLAEVERTITTELAALAKDGPTVAELERARTRALTDVTTSLESIGAFGGTADLLAYYNTYFGDPGKLSWDLQRLLSVTPQSVRGAVATWLATTNRVVLRFHPETSVRPSVAELDRKKQPPLGADTAFHAPSVVADKLANGLELYVVEQHGLPLVTAAIVSRAGSVVDPPGKEGLATLVASTIERGTRSRTALAVASAAGDLGTSLRHEVGLERAIEAVDVYKANLGAALALLGDVVRNPTFPAAEIDRERKLQVEDIEQAERDGRRLAARLRARFAFGADHPYGRPVAGYRKTVGALTSADADAFHATNWRPGAAALVIVGDVTLAEAKALAQKELGSWAGTAPAPPAIPPPAGARGKVFLIDKPDAAQTVAVHIYSAPVKKGDDYYSFLLASEVLGSGASGRLYLNLRQDKGYSYGIGAITPVLSGAMAWITQGGVQTDKTKESVVELVKELKGIAGARPITAKELEDARLGVIRGYAAGFGTNRAVAARVSDLWSRRWPMDEIVREPEGLARATLSEVQAAAKRYAAPADATLVLIGDRPRIEAGVRSLNLGEVIVVDAEGKATGATR
jgi:zinc protease